MRCVDSENPLLGICMAPGGGRDIVRGEMEVVKGIAEWQCGSAPRHKQTFGLNRCGIGNLIYNKRQGPSAVGQCRASILTVQPRYH